MARLPRGFAGERRTEHFSFQLTPSERDHLERLAEARGMLRAELVRSYLPLPAANDDPRRRPEPEKIAVVNALSRIGNNLNQLTKLANQSGRLPEEHALRELSAELKDAFRRVV